MKQQHHDQHSASATAHSTRHQNSQTQLKDLESVHQSIQSSYKLSQSKIKELEESLHQSQTKLTTQAVELDLKVRQELGNLHQQQMHHQRDSLQQTLNSHTQSHQASILEFQKRCRFEQELRRELEAAVQTQKEELSQCKRVASQHSKLELQLQQENHAHSEKQLRLESVLAEKDDELKRLRNEDAIKSSEIRRLDAKLDRMNEDEVGRAKELERAITGYVRSVERKSAQLSM